MTSKRNSLIIRLFREILTPWPLVVLSFLAICIQVGLTIYMPILIGRAVDQIVTVGVVNFDQLAQILGQMIIVILVNAFVQWLNPRIYSKLIYQGIQSLRDRLVYQVHHLPLSYVDQQSTGDLVSRITTDSEQLADGLLMVFNQFLVGILTIVVTIFTMASLDLYMMLTVILLTPISIFVARFIANRSYQLFQKQTESRGKHANLIEESVQELDLIRYFNGQALAKGKFNQINQVYSDYSQAATFYSSTINPTTRFINALIYAVVTLLGAWRIMQGSLTVGQLATFLNYANQYTKPFNDISSVLAEIQSALACAARLYELIDLSPEEETGELELVAESVAGAVTFDAVEFSYDPMHPLIQDLNANVQARQTVAIVGPTGAGKSTLINLLMRFYDVDQGRICLDQVDIRQYTRKSIRQEFGMVLQDSWIKYASIHDNIAYGFPNASREEVIRAAKAAHAHRFISLLADGYDTVIGEGGLKLSTGQEQLIAIARIFVRLPNLLILDEATSSIDTRTEVLIQEAFDRLMEGRTSFIIAHRLSTIQKADLILVMKDGNIIEQGNHHSLMQAKGFYYQLQEAQNGLNYSDN
ncbi:ABC transporter ATP-binding protein [Hutsoniella sourekii]